jgi:cell division septation protein DedD
MRQNEGKALEIKEFGSFFFDEDGELKFNPSNELSTEISYKYAGMQPLVLKPERDTSILPAKEEESDDFDAIAKTSGKEKEAELHAGESVPETGVEPDSKSLKETKAEKPGKKKPLPSKVPSSATMKRKQQPVQRKNGNTGVWIVAAVILLALLAGGILYFFGTSPADTDETVQTTPDTEQTQPTPEELPVITDEQITENIETPPEFGSEQENSDEVSETEEASDEPETAPEETFGLMGSVVEEANDGYSIVLHSFNDEEIARAAATSLSEEGYRALVSSRTVEGNPMWRVSVGQFETIADAQQAANELPEPYNNQNFIHRIQI